jgi:hypothetical protein
VWRLLGPETDRWQTGRVSDQHQSRAVVQNPALFDGPVAVCAGLTEDLDGRAVLEWAR